MKPFYKITVMNGEQKINLTFLNYNVMYETAHELEQLGYEVDAPMHEYEISESVDHAVDVVELFLGDVK